MRGGGLLPPELSPRLGARLLLWTRWFRRLPFPASWRERALSPSRWLSGGQVEPGARGSQGEDPACSLEAKRDGLGMKSKQANYLLTLKAHVLIRRGAISPPHRCRHFPGAAPAGAARCRALAAEGSRRPAPPAGGERCAAGRAGLCPPRRDASTAPNRPSERSTIRRWEAGPQTASEAAAWPR